MIQQNKEQNKIIKSPTGNNNFPLLKYITIFSSMMITFAVAYLFYDLYQQKKQNEQFQAETLAQEYQDKVNIFHETRKNEKEGFEHILNQKYNEAITSFYKASSLTHSHNHVEEIASLLSQNKNAIHDPLTMKNVLLEISTNYSKHAPAGFTVSIRNQIKELEMLEESQHKKVKTREQTLYYEQKGFNQLLRKEYANALKSFQKANQLSPSFHDIPNLIMLLNLYQYDIGDEITTLKMLREISTKYAKHAPVGFSEILNKQIEHEETKNKANYTVMYEQKGFEHLMNAAYSEALVAFQKANQLTPTFNDVDKISELLQKAEKQMNKFETKKRTLLKIVKRYAKHAPQDFSATTKRQLIEEEKEIQVRTYEKWGYYHLAKSNYLKAEIAFENAAKLNRKFHQVNAISKLLQANKDKMYDAQTKVKVLTEVLMKHSQHASKQVIQELQEQIEHFSKIVKEQIKQAPTIPPTVNIP